MQDLLIKQFLPRITFELCWLVLAMVRVCLFRICRCMLDYIFGWIHSFELAGLNGFPLFQITLAWPSFDMYQTRLNWQDQKGFAVIFFYSFYFFMEHRALRRVLLADVLSRYQLF